MDEMVLMIEVNDHEVIRDDNAKKNIPAVERALSHTAYDYYMSYFKDDMELFELASELMDIAIYESLTYPNMIAYINYCKVAASNEILTKLFHRNFKLKEPAAVSIDESFNDMVMELLDENIVADAMDDFMEEIRYE